MSRVAGAGVGAGAVRVGEYGAWGGDRPALTPAPVPAPASVRMRSTFGLGTIVALKERREALGKGAYLNTCVALVGAYLRFNGYVTVPEQPVLIGQGKPYRYHTATDIDILAVRFPNAAVVVPREYGTVEDDLHLDIDPALELEEDTVDVLIAEVKSGRPRLNDGMREPDVLYATLRRVDPGFDVAIDDTIKGLIRNGEATCKSAGKKWRFRLVAFGEGQPALEGGPYMVMQMRHVTRFLMQTMREHHQVWKDAQFGDPVLDLLHFFDKMGFVWRQNERDADAEEEERAFEEERRRPKLRQNEKVAHAPKPVKTAARKNGKSAPKPPFETEMVPANGVVEASVVVEKSKPRAPRKRIESDDGWVPGAG
jgi:hypothetical protein